MATRKNTHKSTCRAAAHSDPLDDYQAVMEKVRCLFRLDRETWAEVDEFVSEQSEPLTQKYGLEDDELDGGLAIMAWIASMCRDAERVHQPQVDATIRYLDPSAST